MGSRFTRVSRGAGALLLLVMSLGAQVPGSGIEPPYEGKDTLESLTARMDVGCILRTWRIKGVLACSHGVDLKVCLWVENAYPCGIFEVLRQSGKTHLAEVKGAMGSLAGALSRTGSSSHTTVAGDGSAGQFGEAHVFTFVPDLGFSNSDVPIAIPSSTRFQVNYASEVDRYGWRSPLVDEWTCPESEVSAVKSCEGVPDPLTCAGTWGTYVPRIGFVVHPSLAIGSAMISLRAGRVASRPFGRIVLGTYDYEPRTGHFLQMIEPIPKPAISIGTPFPALLDAWAGSPFGNYLFVHFGIFDYCAECLPVRLVEPRPPS